MKQPKGAVMKVPLYKINLTFKSNEGKAGEGQPERPNSSLLKDSKDDESDTFRKFKKESASLANKKVDLGIQSLNLQNLQGQQTTGARDKQDADPSKLMDQNKSEQDNNSNFSLESIPSENNEIDEKDEKLKGHATSRLPARNIVVTARGSGLSNYQWSRQSKVGGDNLNNADNNSSNYLNTMEFYQQDSDEVDMSVGKGGVEQARYSNQIMLTEGFPNTEKIGGLQASSFIDKQIKRESMGGHRRDQPISIKSSQIRNPKECLVKKSQINLTSKHDRPAVTTVPSNTSRTQKYPTMFKYLGNMQKQNANPVVSSTVSEKLQKKQFVSKYAATSTQLLKQCSPSNYTNPESSLQNSSQRRQACKQISQISIEDDETHKVVTDDEQDSETEQIQMKVKITNSKTLDNTFSKSLAFYQQDSTNRHSNPKMLGKEVPSSNRVSKVEPTESAKEYQALKLQRSSELKEEDALNDTIDEIRTLNKSNKPKTHRSKFSSDFQQTNLNINMNKMQPSQIIKKSNNNNINAQQYNKTPVKILKIDLQRNQRQQNAAKPASKLASDKMNEELEQSPLRLKSSIEKQYISKQSEGNKKTSTMEFKQSSLKRFKRKQSTEIKLNSSDRRQKFTNFDKVNHTFTGKDRQKLGKNDKNYQLKQSNASFGYPKGSFAAMIKSQSKDDLKINIQKVKENNQFLEQNEKQQSEKQDLGTQLQLNLNSFQIKKKSECVQLVQKKDIYMFEKKCLFANSDIEKSDKKIRQNNSCQNIHSHSSNYLQGNKIIQDVQKIKQINLNSSRPGQQSHPPITSSNNRLPQPQHLHQQTKSSLERIVGSNECSKLFDTIEKIRQTPTFHVKSLSMRKPSNQGRGQRESAASGQKNDQIGQQRALTARGGAGQSEDPRGAFGNAKKEHLQTGEHLSKNKMSQNLVNFPEVNEDDEKLVGMHSKSKHTTKIFNLTKASYLTNDRKKSQSPTLCTTTVQKMTMTTQKTSSQQFVFSSEQIGKMRKSPQPLQSKEPQLSKSNLNETKPSEFSPSRPQIIIPPRERLANDKVGRIGRSRKLSKDNAMSGAAAGAASGQKAKNLNIQVSAQNISSSYLVDSSSRVEYEQHTVEKKTVGERKKSLKQFMIHQKKELFKARKKQQSFIDDDEIKMDERTQTQIDPMGSSVHEVLEQQQEMQEYTAINQIKTTKKINKIISTTGCTKAPLSPQKKRKTAISPKPKRSSQKSPHKKSDKGRLSSPQKKSSLSPQKKNGSTPKTREKKPGSSPKKVVHIDLGLNKVSRNSVDKEDQQWYYNKVSKTSDLASQKQFPQDVSLPYQDLGPLIKEEKMSKSSSMSNVIGERRDPVAAAGIRARGTDHIFIHGESQHEESQDEDPIQQVVSLEEAQRDSDATSSQGDVRASSANLQIYDVNNRHSDIKRQVNQKIKQILKEYRDAIDDQENEKIQRLLQDSAELINAEAVGLVGFSSQQESLETFKSASSVEQQRSNLQQNKNKTGKHILFPVQIDKENKQRKAGVSTGRKERQTWKKKAAAELSSQDQPQKQQEQIDLRNQIQIINQLRNSITSSNGDEKRKQRNNFPHHSEERQSHSIDSAQNFGRPSSVEFFLTQSNGGGAGSRIMLKAQSPVAIDVPEDTLIRSCDFSGDSMVSPPSSQIDQQQILQLKKQLDQIAKAIEKGNLEKTRHHGDAISAISKKRDRSNKRRFDYTGELSTSKRKAKKEDRGGQKKRGLDEQKESEEESSGPFSPKQNNQPSYGYFLNMNDGQMVNLLPMTSQIHQQPLQQQLEGSQQLGQIPMPPNQVGQQQQQQIVWMPVPISHMTAQYAGGHQGMPLPPQNLSNPGMMNYHPLQAQPVGVMGQQNAGAIQMQPFVTGAPLVSAPPTTYLPSQSPIRLGVPTVPHSGQQSLFGAQGQQSLYGNNQILNQQFLQIDQQQAAKSGGGTPKVVEHASVRSSRSYGSANR